MQAARARCSQRAGCSTHAHTHTHTHTRTHTLARTHTHKHAHSHTHTHTHTHKPRTSKQTCPYCSCAVPPIWTPPCSLTSLFVASQTCCKPSLFVASQVDLRTHHLVAAPTCLQAFINLYFASVWPLPACGHSLIYTLRAFGLYLLAGIHSSILCERLASTCLVEGGVHCVL